MDKTNHGFEFAIRDVVAMAEFVLRLQVHHVEYTVINLAGGWRIVLE